MDLDPRPELPNPSPDLENLKSDRVKLRPRPSGALEMTAAQGLSQDVGHRVQEQAELIGLEPMAGGPVGAKMGLMVLDQKLHRSPLAVELLVDDPRSQSREIRDYETRVGSEGVMLGFDDDPRLFVPAPGSIGELAEVADRGSLLQEAPLGLLHQVGGPIAQDRIRRQPQEETQILGPAKIEDLGGGIVRIAPQQDAHVGPGLANLSDDPLEDRHDLLSRGPSPRPQDGGDQLPAPSLVDMDRQITELVVVGVEEGQLLMPVGRVFSIVDVEEDSGRRRPVGVDERVDQGFSDPVEIGPGDGVLQPGERRLAGQGLVFGKLVAGQLHGRIGAQRVGVVGVLVAAGDLEDSLAEHLPDGMAGIAGMTAVADDLGDPANKAKVAFDFPEEKNAGVGGDLTAVKIGLDLFSPDIFKKKAFGAKIIHGCFLLPGLGKRIVDQYVRRGNSFFMNNSG